MFLSTRTVIAVPSIHQHRSYCTRAAIVRLEIFVYRYQYQYQYQ